MMEYEFKEGKEMMQNFQLLKGYSWTLKIGDDGCYIAVIFNVFMRAIS